MGLLAKKYYFTVYFITSLFISIVDTAEVVRQCKAAIPTFSGIKYSCRELGNYDAALMECENGRYKMAVGTVDEVLYTVYTNGICQL